MEETTKLHSPKCCKASNPVSKRPIRSSQSQPLRVISNTDQKHARKEQKSPPKSPEKEYVTKPLIKEKNIYKAEKSFRLHSEERALQRKSYNFMVASKINSMEIIRRFEEKILKVIEEEEIKVMRKEMVPKAQLMPHFNRPFYPQRSTRPLTKPKEPSFLKQNCCIGGEFHRHFCFNTKAIK
ncbi:hypothetical protein LUZ60_013665 [Juncus effusus]|nr:hypothetical protein LUZ60_013665 [Juncus effusus]